MTNFYARVTLHLHDRFKKTDNFRKASLLGCAKMPNQVSKYSIKYQFSGQFYSWTTLKNLHNIYLLINYRGTCIKISGRIARFTSALKKRVPITQSKLVTTISTKHDDTPVTEFLWDEAVRKIHHSVTPMRRL